MRKRLSAIITLVLLTNAFISTPAHAQGTTSSILSLLKPVSGTIDDKQTQQTWTFQASANQHISVRMQASSGDLEPTIDLLDESGKVQASGTNAAAYHNAIIDDFLIPQTGVYTLRASRAKTDKATSGDYNLMILPGYSFLLLNDPGTNTTLLRSWSLYHSSARPSEGKFRLQTSLQDKYIWTTVDKLGVFKDLYLQADVEVERSSGYWEQGLLIRGTQKADTLQFYVLLVNSDGKWKFAISTPDALTTIQDWTDLPVKLTDQATIGVMASGDKFTVFYDGNLISQLTDDTLSDPGTFGIVVGTGKAAGSYASMLYDNVVVTLPNTEATGAPIIAPKTLTQWQRTEEMILQELGNDKLIPGAGRSGVKLYNAYAKDSTPGGIVFVPLAHSLSFTDFVYTSDITWESSNDNIACALEFRATDPQNFSIVYIDRKAGYGIRQLDGGTVITSYYDLSDAIHKDNRNTNRLMIIAIGNSLIVYINGTLVANMNVRQTSGGVSIAAYNYEAASTRCQFTNLWLQTFDP